MTSFTLRLVAGLSTLCAAAVLTSTAAHAEPQGLVAAAQTRPRAASPSASHRLGQHPAVLVKAKAQGINPNQFIVQPPATVTWRVAPDADPATRWAAPEGSPSDEPIRAVDTSVASRGG